MTASDNHMEIRSGENCSYVAICSGNGCKVVSVRDGRICPEEEQVPDSVRLGRDARFDIVYIVLPGASCGWTSTEKGLKPMSPEYICATGRMRSG